MIGTNDKINSLAGIKRAPGTSDFELVGRLITHARIQANALIDEIRGARDAGL